MDTTATHLTRAFSQMGARLKLVLARSTSSRDFALDVKRDRHGEYFEVATRPDLDGTLQVLDIQKSARHLLLMVRRPPLRAGLPHENEKFLCGHDERQWFAAAVPGGSVSSVRTAMDQLKPAAVREAQARLGLKPKHRFSRHNAAFLRQGEWFFLPMPDLHPDPNLIFRNEPLQRGRNKPHIAEQAYRVGGLTVYVCRQSPNGLDELSYRTLLENQPEAKRWNWRTMRRDMTLYVKGAIKHPDHKTLGLACWHQVIPNTETEAPSMRSLTFLD